MVFPERSVPSPRYVHIVAHEAHEAVARNACVEVELVRDEGASGLVALVACENSEYM